MSEAGDSLYTTGNLTVPLVYNVLVDFVVKLPPWEFAYVGKWNSSLVCLLSVCVLRV